MLVSHCVSECVREKVIYRDGTHLKIQLTSPENVVMWKKGKD